MSDQRFTRAIEAFTPALPLAVAYSGGADSTALLAACVRRWPGQVRAIHVHHGLQPAADGFVRHCQAECARWNVPLAVRHVDGRHGAGESPEAAARQARYGALAAAAHAWEGGPPLTDVALAQHADDQVETLLLALSRGAGLPGLAGMPARMRRDGIVYHRPLLQVPAAAIRAWLADTGLAFVEDPSNGDPRYTRNRIRSGLLPALDATFPGHREAFARSMRHAAQGEALLLELAQLDLAAAGRPPQIARLQALGRARQGNALRCWLREQHGAVPTAAQLEELLDQVAACTTRGHGIRIKVARGFVQRDGDRLRYGGTGPAAPL